MNTWKPQIVAAEVQSISVFLALAHFGFGLIQNHVFAAACIFEKCQLLLFPSGPTAGPRFPIQLGSCCPLDLNCFQCHFLCFQHLPSLVLHRFQFFGGLCLAHVDLGEALCFQNWPILLFSAACIITVAFRFVLTRSTAQGVGGLIRHILWPLGYVWFGRLITFLGAGLQDCALQLVKFADPRVAQKSTSHQH